MGLFSKNKKIKAGTPVCAVQTSMASTHPWYQFSSFTPLCKNNLIYATLRENVPIIDAAISKIVRLCASFHFETGNERLDEQINEFFDNINVGGNQIGLYAFVATYLSELLTYGSAVGEMIADGKGLYALYNGELNALEVKRAENNLDLEFYNSNQKIANQDLILFSALNPEPGKILGTSLLRGLPFVSDILLKIYNTIGENWEHAGNLRYAVTYKPQGDTDGSARESAQQIADAWRDAMSSKDAVKDFVAVGDVSVKVIGADSAVLESQIPVRQLLEQIVAKTGIPPYMLGLTWSTTERMSMQQADILTTELEAYRRILSPVISKIGRKYLQVNGIASPLFVVWDDITLQDETETARARLYDAQAEKNIKGENELKEGYIVKGYAPEQSDLEKIRQFTRKEFSEEELFTFTVNLCNNDVDRDFEKFSVSALNELAEQFIGKTGIKDHSMKSENQTARVFDTAVEKIDGRKTADGEDYYVLRAKAYMVRTDENRSLITEIEAGIKKEVSVSCSMGKTVCSICGKDMKRGGCNHILGKAYDKKQCFGILTDALDAYEWSFVAVPAQREAGVTKSFNLKKGSVDMEDVTKCLKGKESEITLSRSDADALYSYCSALEEEAELGREYKKSLMQELTALCAKSLPQLDLSTFQRVASIMTAKELVSFKNAFEKQQAQKDMPAPQLARAQKEQKANYKEFKI